MLFCCKLNHSYSRFIKIVKHCQTRGVTNVPAISSSFSEVWKSVIGLEIHAQLMPESKLFSKAPSCYGAPTNSNVALFDAAIPGTLPVLNAKAVELAVKSALAFKCKINPVSYFDRKHYFYSDLPAGYQITQERLPLAVNGVVEYAIYQPGIHKEPYYKKCKIKKIQLEQDSGKTYNEPTSGQCFIDLNRAGIALIEIVLEPEVNDPEEACALVKEINKILQRASACSGKLEEGALRVDVNVSLNREGDSDLGVRTEIKNIGSVHGVGKAIKCEVERQIRILENGGRIRNETLAWDPNSERTIPMRDKEEKQDYRFMPEPNLPPLRLIIDEYSDSYHKNIKVKSSILNLRDLKEEIPSLPQDERLYLIEKFGLNDIFAYNLVNKDKLYQYFVKIIKDKGSRDPKLTYNLLIINLLGALNANKISLEDCTVPAEYLGQIVDLIQTRRVSRRTSVDLIKDLVQNKNSLSPIEAVEKYNLGLISNPKELKKICLRVLEKEEVAVAAYRKKKKQAIFNNLVQKVIEESKFRADSQILPKLVGEVLDEINAEK